MPKKSFLHLRTRNIATIYLGFQLPLEDVVTEAIYSQ